MSDGTKSEFAESTDVWLAKRYLDECSVQFRAVWDLYLKFYVMFLTVNVTALGLVINVASSKGLISIAFIMQNLLAGSTAIQIARYSSEVATRAQKLAEFLAAGNAPVTISSTSVLAASPIPGKLGSWGGYANFAGHLVLSHFGYL